MGGRRRRQRWWWQAGWRRSSCDGARKMTRARGDGVSGSVCLVGWNGRLFHPRRASCRQLGDLLTGAAQGFVDCSSVRRSAHWRGVDAGVSVRVCVLVV